MNLARSHESSIEPRVAISNNDSTVKFYDVPVKCETFPLAIKDAGMLRLDVAGRLTGPAFVQPHIHLDKVGVATMLEPNRSGTLAEAISLLHQIKRMARPEEIARGVAVVIKATHHCMVSRGIHKRGTDLVTSRMLGCFRDYPMTRGEFLSMVNSDVER